MGVIRSLLLAIGLSLGSVIVTAQGPISGSTQGTNNTPLVFSGVKTVRSMAIPDYLSLLGVTNYVVMTSLPFATNAWEFWMVGTNDYRTRRQDTSLSYSSNDFAGLLQYAYEQSAAQRVHFHIAASTDAGGHYLFSKTVELTNAAKFFTIEGEGNPSTVLVPMSTMPAGSPMFRVGASTEAIMASLTCFRKLRFQANLGGFGDVHTNTLTAIKIENAAEPVLEDIEFSQFFVGVDMATPTSLHWGYLENCWFVGITNVNSAGLLMSGDGSTISDLRVLGAKFYLEGGHGMWVSNSFDNITVAGSIFHLNQGLGAGIKSTLGTNIAITGNQFNRFASGRVPIVFDARGAPQNVVASITGNTMSGGGTNMVTLGANVEGVDMMSNSSQSGVNNILNSSLTLLSLSTPTNYAAGDKSLKGNLDGVDVALGVRQPLDSDLTTIAGLVGATTNSIMKWNGAAWAIAPDNDSVAGGGGVWVDGAGVANPDFDSSADILNTVSGGTNVTMTIKTNTINSGHIVTDAVSSDELNATGVESELEAVLDLDQLQGAVTDGQVPDSITITLAATATTANAGDSATAFFGAGTIEHERGGLEADVSGYTDGLYGQLSGATADIDTLAEFDTAIGITGTPDATTFWRGDNSWAAATAADPTTTLPSVISVGAEFSSTGIPTATLPGTHAADDILVLVLQTSNDALVAAPAGYTQVGPQNGLNTGAAAGANRLCIFWKRDGGAESAPTLVDTGDHTYGMMFAVRGCRTAGNPFFFCGNNFKFTTSTAGTSPSCATTIDNMLITDIFANSVDNATGQGTLPVNADLGSLTAQFNDGTADGTGGGIYVLSGTKIASGTIAASTLTWSTTSMDLCSRLVWIPSDTVDTSSANPPVEVQVFIGSPTDLDDAWIKPTGASRVLAQLCDGGGSGSGGNTTGTASGGGGGGGGGYSEAWFTASELAASVTVHAGKGGASVALAAVGNPGVLSEFNKGSRGPLTSVQRIAGTAATAAITADGGNGGCGSGVGTISPVVQTTRRTLNDANAARATGASGGPGGSGTTAPTGGSEGDWGGGGGESGADTDAATAIANNGTSMRGGGGGSSGRTNGNISGSGSGGNALGVISAQGAAGTDSTRLPYGGSGGVGGGTGTAAGGSGGFPGGGGGGGGGVANGSGGRGGHGCVVVTAFF